MPVVCKGLMNLHGRMKAVVFQAPTEVGPVYMSFNHL